MPTILSVILILVLMVSVSVFVKRRKKAGVTGIKSALTSICLYLMAIINLFAYWFDFSGVVTWTITTVLIILGVYFTKYLPVSRSKS
ncbi:MAG TPA: hypothetical protein IAA78_04135 [Candidatus Avamphibacillus intestinigallinarum]|nr:hypothetical protein [Candidatus Avamphibacillus intestinigallinarum]